MENHAFHYSNVVHQSPKQCMVRTMLRASIERKRAMAYNAISIATNMAQTHTINISQNVNFLFKIKSQTYFILPFHRFDCIFPSLSLNSFSLFSFQHANKLMHTKKSHEHESWSVVLTISYRNKKLMNKI